MQVRARSFPAFGDFEELTIRRFMGVTLLAEDADAGWLLPPPCPPPTNSDEEDVDVEVLTGGRSCAGGTDLEGARSPQLPPAGFSTQRKLSVHH